MYVKLTNGNVDTYPYNVGQLRRDNPTTSFPKRVSNDMLAEYNVYPVTVLPHPDIDNRTQKLEQQTVPTQVNGAWLLNWTIVNKTTEEVQQYDDNAVNSVRDQRNTLLVESDWTQVLDAPVDQAAWATYRQALRDITAQEGFPHNVTWPTKP